MGRRHFHTLQLKTGTLTIISAFFLVLSSCSNQPLYPAPAQAGTDAAIAVSGLKQEVPEFFTYRYKNKNINFFVMKIDKRVLSFLDACVTCYPRKLGYRYDDGYVVCRACNQRFSVYKLEKGFGGCFPIPITGRVENGKYLIAISTLEKMADKF